MSVEANINIVVVVVVVSVVTFMFPFNGTNRAAIKVQKKALV